MQGVGVAAMTSIFLIKWWEKNSQFSISFTFKLPLKEVIQCSNSFVNWKLSWYISTKQLFPSPCYTTEIIVMYEGHWCCPYWPFYWGMYAHPNIRDQSTGHYSMWTHSYQLKFIFHFNTSLNCNIGYRIKQMINR